MVGQLESRDRVSNLETIICQKTYVKMTVLLSTILAANTGLEQSWYSIKLITGWQSQPVFIPPWPPWQWQVKSHLVPWGWENPWNIVSCQLKSTKKENQWFIMICHFKMICNFHSLWKPGNWQSLRKVSFTSQPTQ